MTRGINQKTGINATLDFGAQLWAAASKMPGQKAHLMPVREDLANPRLDSTLHPSPLVRRRGEIRHGELFIVQSAWQRIRAIS
jgi:hypothetical protein